jgi:TusA-related sulfurtransferase
MRPASKRVMIVLPTLMVTIGLFTLTSASAEEASGPMVSTRMNVSGEITKIQSGMVFVKTSVGQLTMSAKGIHNPQVGQEVVMWVNGDNAVIDVHKKGESVPLHRLITGNLTYASENKTELKLWTPEGEKAFPVGAPRDKLAGVKEGTHITVELNERGEVIDIHHMEITIQMDPGARTRPGYHLQVNGKVSKIKSRLIFVDTPVGQFTLTSRLGLRDAKVGDEVALWVNQNNLIVDAHKKGEGLHHRLIFGNLQYASDDKTEIKLSTPEGEKTFSVARGKSKLATMKEGTLIRVEVNERGEVIDVRKVG